MKKCLLSAMMVALSLLAVAQTFTEVRDIHCGDTAYVTNLGYPTWNPPQFVNLPNYGHAALLGDFIAPNLLQYTAPPFFEGVDTVVIECAHATQITCDTGIYVFNISCPVSISPVFTSLVSCNDQVYIGNLSGWWAPQLQQQAQHGQAQVILEPADGAGVLYKPNPGFEGVDAVIVSLMGGAQTYLYLFQVYCDLPTNSRDLTSVVWEVFPNPTKALLYINNAENAQWTLVDTRGGIYPLQLQSKGDLSVVDLSTLPGGIYILVGQTTNGRYINRIVKQ